MCVCLPCTFSCFLNLLAICLVACILCFFKFKWLSSLGHYSFQKCRTIPLKVSSSVTYRTHSFVVLRPCKFLSLVLLFTTIRLFIFTYWQRTGWFSTWGINWVSVHFSCNRNIYLYFTLGTLRFLVCTTNVISHLGDHQPLGLAPLSSHFSSWLLYSTHYSASLCCQTFRKRCTNTPSSTFMNYC